MLFVDKEAEFCNVCGGWGGNLASQASHHGIGLEDWIVHCLGGKDFGVAGSLKETQTTERRILIKWKACASSQHLCRKVFRLHGRSAETSHCPYWQCPAK